MSKVTLEKSQEQYIVDANGNKTAVILDIALYEQMLEDIHDLAVVAERRSQHSISLADMKKRLSLNGTLSN
jgi:PHD/YefM family antitoxin component YafN of YafNO toxin-antitoxin module